MTYILCAIPPDPSRVSKVVMLAGLAALASLGACTCGVGEPPEVSTAADAQVKDAAYCAELARLALRYTGHAAGNGGPAPDFTNPYTLNACNNGNTPPRLSIPWAKPCCTALSLPH